MKPIRALLLSCLLGVATPARAGSSGGLGPSVLRAPVTEKVAEQGILTPVPVRIELPRDMPVRRVLVHYKLFGAPEWTTLDLSRRGSYWEALVPCLEVSTVTGDLIYYIRIHDVDGGVIGYSGSRHEPYRVRIVHPSSHPGILARRCPDPTDCPAGLPGCPGERVQRVPCSSDTDCEGGKTCGWDGFCEAVERRRSWLGLELEQDLGVVSATGACNLASQESEGYACYRRSDGARYTGSPVYSNEPVAVGLAQARLVVGYDRLFFYGSTFGLRLGYSLSAHGPTPAGGATFFPFLVELRIAHWFGADPFAREGLRPYVYVQGGAGMFDIGFPVHVREDPSIQSLQGGNALHQTLDGWKRAGDGFVGVGGGVLLAFSPGSGPSFELGIAQVFPFGAMVLIPRLGWRAGF